MYQKFLEYLRNHKPIIIALCIVQLYLWVFALGPFLLQDNLQTWDHPGHKAAIHYLAEHIFPNYTGWNQSFYLGYPQNTFYPPLYHYLAALISFVTGVDIAMKLLYALSVSLLPLSMIYFLKKIHFSNRQTAIGMSLMMFSIIGYSVHIGGNLTSTLYVGLASNAFALPLLFIYLGIVWQARKSILIPTIILTILSLSHYIIALSAGILVSLYVITNSSKAHIIWLLKHFTLTAGLIAFWLVPLLGFFEYYGGEQLALRVEPYLTIPAFLLLTLAIWKTMHERDKKLQFIMFVTIGFLVLSYFDFSFTPLPLHAYRFSIVFMLFSFLLMTALFSNKKLMTISILLLLWQVAISIHAQKDLYTTANHNAIYKYKNFDVSYTTQQIPKPSGRMLNFMGIKEPHLHDGRVEIAISTGIEQLKGLFVESAVNGRFIFGLHAAMVKGGFYWGVRPEHLSGTFESPEIPTPLLIQKTLDLFNVTHALVSVEVPGLTPIRKVTVIKNQEPLYYYQVGNSSVVDVLNYTPKVVAEETEWMSAVKEWMQIPDRKVLVNQEFPKGIATEDASVEIIEQQHEYLRFKVSSNEPVPVLIKISEFPRWKAYANGEETKIYRASPYLMLIHATGDIELKYKLHRFDYIGYVISILTLLYIFIVRHRIILKREVHTSSSLD